MKYLTLAFYSLGLVACSSFKPQGAAVLPNPRFETLWVKPTVNQSFQVHRKMNRMTPILTEDYVLQGNNLKDLVLLSRKTGREIWRKEFKGGVEAGAVIFKNRIYVTANDGTISSLDLKTAETLWSFATSSENVSAPVLDTDTGFLYFQNAQNTLFCLDGTSGRQLWIYSKNDNSLITIRGAATPEVINGTVYAGFSEGSFVALKATTGTVLWEQNLNRNKKFKDIDAQAVAYKGQIIISGYDDKIYSLNAQSGQLAWTFPAGSYSAVSVSQDFLYAATTDARVVKLKADTGELVWAYSDVKGLATQVVSFQDYVLFGESQGYLKVLKSNTGKLLTYYEPGRGVFSKPLFDHKTQQVLFISGEAYVYNLKLNMKPTEAFSFTE